MSFIQKLCKLFELTLNNNESNGTNMHVNDDIMKAHNKNNIDETTQKDFLAIAYSLKGDIAGV